MPHHVFVSYAHEDDFLASHLENMLLVAGYTVFRDTRIPGGGQLTPEIETAIKSSLAVIVLISKNSAHSDWVAKECALALNNARQLIPVLIQVLDSDSYPRFLSKDIKYINATMNPEEGFHRAIESLPEPEAGRTFGEARDAYLQRATLKSRHTIAAYDRAIRLFFDFLADRQGRTQGVPLQKNNTHPIPEAIPLAYLTAEDAPIFLHFAQWLLSPSSGKKDDKRPYKPSTVQLRLAGVQNWFQFMDDHGWLPARFPLAKAKRIVRDELHARSQRDKPPQPPEHIEEVIYYYDDLQPPPHLRKPEANPDRVQRWELTRLRNRALLRCLAETGGRISEILSLNLADFPPRYLNRQEVLRVEVTGKGGHAYYLRFLDSLPALRAYITARGADLRSSITGDVPLFVSHDPRYDGNRMSRVVAWRIVQRAARALGLHSITPHDFRHWRATQLINAGHSLDVVQEYLGHRSVETTRAYYAHTDPLRVDDAARNTGLPSPDDAL